MTVNPFGAARTWLVLARRYPAIPVIGGSGMRSIYPYAHVLSRYVREVRPQVLVSALPGADAAAVCAAGLMERAVPVVVTVHNVPADYYAPEWLAASRMLYPLADAVGGGVQGRGRVRAAVGGGWTPGAFAPSTSPFPPTAYEDWRRRKSRTPGSRTARRRWS